MSAELDIETLRELAKREGVLEVAVTDAAPFPELIPWLEAYEARGRTGFEVGRSPCASIHVSGCTRPGLSS